MSRWMIPNVAPPAPSLSRSAHAAILWRWTWRVILATTITGLYAAYNLLLHESFETRNYDLGIYGNIAWNLSRGRGFYCDVYKHNMLGEHFSPIVAIVAPLYRVWPDVLTLMIAQSLLVAITFVLVIQICKAVFNSESGLQANIFAAVIVLVFFLYRPVNSAIAAQFHPCTLGMPMIALAILAMHRRQHWLVAATALVLLTTKENASLSVIGLGLYSMFVMRDRTAGAKLILTGIVAGVVVMGVLMPAFREGHWEHYDRLAPLEKIPDKLQYLALLLAGLAFLPVLAWRALVPAAPLVALNLLVSTEMQFGLRHHYDDQSSVFLIVAAAHGLNRLWVWMMQRRAACVGTDERVAAMGSGPTALISVGVIAIACACARGFIPLQLPRLWQARQSEVFTSMREQIKAFNLAHPDDPVMTQNGLGPHLCNRDDFTHLRPHGINGTGFKPGQCLIVSPAARGYNQGGQKLVAALRTNKRFRIVHEDANLMIYQCIAPVGTRKEDKAAVVSTSDAASGETADEPDLSEFNGEGG